MSRAQRGFSLILLLLLNLPFIFAGNKSYGQIQPPLEEKQANAIISILPLYLTVNGLRVDFDKAINKNHWIQAGPVVFLSEAKNNTFFISDESYTRHTGAGLHLYHKYYPGEGFGKTHVYISYGGMWHYNHIKYNAEVGSSAEKYSAIHKMGADLIMGLYGVVSERLLLELYTGLGLRHSVFKTDGIENRKYNSTYISPGYSGNIFIAGLRIGFITRRNN